MQTCQSQDVQVCGKTPSRQQSFHSALQGGSAAWHKHWLQHVLGVPAAASEQRLSQHQMLTNLYQLSLSAQQVSLLLLMLLSSALIDILPLDCCCKLTLHLVLVFALVSCCCHSLLCHVGTTQVTPR